MGLGPRISSMNFSHQYLVLCFMILYNICIYSLKIVCRRTVYFGFAYHSSTLRENHRLVSLPPTLVVGVKI